MIKTKWREATTYPVTEANWSMEDIISFCAQETAPCPVKDVYIRASAVRDGKILHEVVFKHQISGFVN